MGRKAYTNAFTGGEISPLMIGHIEDEGYRTGFARGRNMLLLPTGAAQKRPQFEFVHAAKAVVSPIRLFPFVYGDGDSYALEVGPNHFRFHADGGTLMVADGPAPPAFKGARQVASFDNANDQLDTTVVHGLATGDEVVFSFPTNATSLPAGLLYYTVYYAIVVDTNTLSVATTRANAIASPPVVFAFGAGGAGTNFISHVDREGDLVSFTGANYYASFDSMAGIVPPNPTPVTCTMTASVVTAVAHGLISSTAIVFALNGGTLPPEVVPGVTYFARPITVDTFSISPAWDSLVNIAFAGSSTGSPTVSRLDLWHEQPATGEYEIPHTLGAAGIAALNYDQSFDVWTFVSSAARAAALSRLAATRWVIDPVDPSPGPPPPVLSLTTRVFGENYAVSVAAGGSVFSVPTAVRHGLVPGDVVYLEGTLGLGSAMTGIANTPGFFMVTELTTPPNNTFQMREVNGHAIATNSTGAIQTGFLRVVGSSSHLTESYVVTAIRDGDESLQSNVLVVTNNLDVPGSSNVLTWTAVTGAQRYRLYKKIDDAYGLILETASTTATDDGIGPDLATQPPIFDDGLLTEFPRAVANFQQRGWLGGTDLHPRRVWGGKTGTVSTMSYHERTLLDTDRIRIDVAVRERTLVRHIVSASQLWVMTSAAEIKLTGQNTDVLSPVIGIDARGISQKGCTGVRPIVAYGNVLFVGARDGHVYELPVQTLQRLEPPDLSVRAAHLFDGLTISQSAQQDSPVPIEWWVRSSDGALLGLTYMPEQNIRGWHVHTAAGTNAVIESACVIPDNDGQRLYAVIARTINGSTVRHIERMGRIAQPTTLTACKYLDSCITYSGAPATSIPVAHLPGEIVYAVADGVKKGPFTVTGGVIVLDAPASTVHVGLQFANSLRTLPPIMTIDGFGKGTQQAVAEATLRVDQSCGFSVAVYSDDGFQRTAWAANGIDDTAMRSLDVSVPIEPSIGRNAQIDITQLSPFPLTIVSVTLDVDTGGP